MGCTGGVVALVDVLGGVVTATQRLHSDDVRAMVVGVRAGGSQTAWADTRVVTTSFDGTGCVWSLAPEGGGGGAGRAKMGQQVFVRQRTLAGHLDKILSVSFAPASVSDRRGGGRSGLGYLLTSGADGQVLAWENPM